MISPVASTPETDAVQVLVRYGSIPRVARYTMGTANAGNVDRGTGVIIATDRGQELGEILEIVPPAMAEGHESTAAVVRIATSEDLSLHSLRQRQAAESFYLWLRRIQDWQLELELMDIEATLDNQVYILYVLNDRGAETTRLALLAAAAGLGIVHVQPVAAEGLVDGTGGGGGGCGDGCGCSR